MSPLPNRSELSKHWDLDSNIVFLNHGSFGACPNFIFDKYINFQKELESNPIKFLDDDIQEKILFSQTASKFYQL